VTIELTWRLGLAIVLLLGVAVAASAVGRLGQGRAMIAAGARAVVQLAAVSTIVVVALTQLPLAVAFCVVMFGIGVVTTARRTGVGRAWPWSAVAMASGVLPVLLIVFATGTAPFTGAALVPIAGIVIGNMMTVHTLAGRRQFATLRDHLPTYEAALAVGLTRSAAIELVTETTAREALYPNLDQTRTVGLVTLPGAFIGVLLGGGSPVQAGAAQILVLIGIMAGQAVVVTVAHRLMMAHLLLPPDLKARLRP
jgi:putative ABC transport system permease protein